MSIGQQDVFGSPIQSARHGAPSHRAMYQHEQSPTRHNDSLFSGGGYHGGNSSNSRLNYDQVGMGLMPSAVPASPYPQ